MDEIGWYGWLIDYWMEGVSSSIMQLSFISSTSFFWCSHEQILIVSRPTWLVLLSSIYKSIRAYWEITLTTRLQLRSTGPCYVLQSCGHMVNCNGTSTTALYRMDLLRYPTMKFLTHQLLLTARPRLSSLLNVSWPMKLARYENAKLGRLLNETAGVSDYLVNETAWDCISGIT